MYSTIAQYVGGNPLIYQCPSSIVVVKAYQASKLVRTVSMNGWVGYNASGTNTDAYKYRIYQKTSMINGGLGPSDLFVFMEERGESIDDGMFLISAPGSLNATTVANMPMNAHNMGATIGFADGHVEVHRWRGLPNFSSPNMNITTPQQAICPKWANPIGTVGGFVLGDLGWQEQHATAPK
jgi:prepilin-type processing-associated H-X9-DG protein